MPLTEWVRTEPARMPTESVARRAKVVPRRWLRMRWSQLEDVLVGVSIGRSDLFRLLPVARTPGSGRSIKYSLWAPCSLSGACRAPFGWLDAKRRQRWFHAFSKCGTGCEFMKGA